MPTTPDQRAEEVVRSLGLDNDRPGMDELRAGIGREFWDAAIDVREQCVAVIERACDKLKAAAASFTEREVTFGLVLCERLIKRITENVPEPGEYMSDSVGEDNA